MNDRQLILVVDDVEDNRDVYATYFAWAGFRVQEAADGEAALDLITHEQPAAVIMDLAMSRLDGWEATRLIKSNPRTKNIVVIVVTAHATADDVSRARACGADEVLTKPCLPELVLDRVRQKLLE